MTEDEGTGGEQGKAAPKIPLWKRVPKWLIGVVIGALAAALSATLFEPWFTKGINAVTETGDPLTVNTVEISGCCGDFFVVPSNISVTDSDAAKARDIEQFISSRNAVRTGNYGILLGVTGNRADKVRIMDIAPLQKCGPPLNGAYFQSPPAGADQIITVHLNLDLPKPVAMDEPPWSASRGGPEPKPYFETNTVSLEKDEQVIFKINVYVEKMHCDFELELSILQGSTTHKQIINNHGELFSITPKLPMKEWHKVYLGGVQCGSAEAAFRPATRAYIETEDTYPDDPCEKYPSWAR